VNKKKILKWQSKVKDQQSKENCVKKRIFSMLENFCGRKTVKLNLCRIFFPRNAEKWEKSLLRTFSLNYFIRLIFIFRFSPWKVSNFNSQLIKHAQKFNFDFFFLIFLIFQLMDFQTNTLKTLKIRFSLYLYMKKWKSENREKGSS
jgi:hypothetical protein